MHVGYIRQTDRQTDWRIDNISVVIPRFAIGRPLHVGLYRREKHPGAYRMLHVTFKKTIKMVNHTSAMKIKKILMKGKRSKDLMNSPALLGLY